MFFHRAIGKITFPLIAIAFCLLSVQTTWQFLNAALPHESWLYKVLGLAVFELGTFSWFSLLTSGAENVLRTLIALVMTVICVGGVATAAIYEIGSQMQDLGFQMDPAFLQWTPLCVLVGMVATLIATLLYMAASPHVAHRFAHMNATGQEPPIGSYIQRLPSTQVQLQQTGQLPPVSQPLALPAPASIQQSRQGFMAGIGNFFSRLGAGLQNNGPTTYAPVQADEPGEVPVNELVAEADGAQEAEQKDAFAQAMADLEAATKLPLGDAQYSVAGNRAPSARKRTTKSKAAARRSPEDLVALLEMIDKGMPGKSAADLARMVGCDESTVRRYRAASKQQGRA